MAIEVCCTEAKPIIHRMSRGVASWLCRIEVKTESASAFDIIQVPTVEPWKPLEQWTTPELIRYLETIFAVSQTGALPPYVRKFQQLVGIAKYREEFTEESQSLITGKGTDHELSGSRLYLECSAH